MKTPESYQKPNGGSRSLDRMVLLRLSEIVTLVRCLRAEAYDCRHFAQETEHDDLRRQALNAARRLEERATQLAQENAQAD